MKAYIKHLIPPAVLNTILLRFPFLYHTTLVNFESNFQKASAIQELLAQLATTLACEGDIIECGSSRCGTSAIMARYLRDHHLSRHILSCDSYAGFDLAELQREQAAGLTTARSDAFTSTSYTYVTKKIIALGLQDMIIPIKGYFQETLPALSGPFCCALIDCDLQESLLFAAETLWPRLASHGLLLFDDYLTPTFKGAKPGVDTFVEKHRHEIASHGLLTHFYVVRKP